ncbi:hypothetical protein DDE01_11890 [Desulfovibrio desulfuricans]|nr:hypothetical protein DDE01_11890 [Desulfovibrio desulfuricans]
MSREFYRLFAGSDVHAGHMAGLTPPDWHYPLDGARGDLGSMQRELWGWFAETVDSLRPFDGAAWVGDLIDGDGHRSAGTELITTDRNEQCDMARGVVRFVGAPANRFVYGTSYHTGHAEDFERIIADEFDAKITDQAWIRKHGVAIHLKHHVGGTSIPHGKGTALMKDMLWNLLWAEMEAQPKANIYLRGHTHRYIGIDDVGPKGSPRMGFCLPALQAAQTKFGGRRCSGIVHFGFMHFDIYPDGGVQWARHILNVQAAVPAVEEL